MIGLVVPLMATAYYVALLDTRGDAGLKYRVCILDAVERFSATDPSATSVEDKSIADCKPLERRAVMAYDDIQGDEQKNSQLMTVTRRSIRERVVEIYKGPGITTGVCEAIPPLFVQVGPPETYVQRHEQMGRLMRTCFPYKYSVTSPNGIIMSYMVTGDKIERRYALHDHLGDLSVTTTYRSARVFVGEAKFWTTTRNPKLPQHSTAVCYFRLSENTEKAVDRVAEKCIERLLEPSAYHPIPADQG